MNLIAFSKMISEMRKRLLPMYLVLTIFAVVIPNPMNLLLSMRCLLGTNVISYMCLDASLHIIEGKI